MFALINILNQLYDYFYLYLPGTPVCPPRSQHSSQSGRRRASSSSTSLILGRYEQIINIGETYDYLIQDNKTKKLKVLFTHNSFVFVKISVMPKNISHYNDLIKIICQKYFLSKSLNFKKNILTQNFFGPFQKEFFWAPQKVSNNWKTNYIYKTNS